MEKLSERDEDILDLIFDPFQPLGLNSNSKVILKEAVEAEEDPELSTEAKVLLKKAILLSEQGEFDEAFQTFDALKQLAPGSASVLNDRAQALQLAGRHEEALRELSRALELSEGRRSRAGIQALCQRAALYRYLERDDEAREDFAKAAEAGSKFAKSQLVAMNPYAAMCNAMLQKISVARV